MLDVGCGTGRVAAALTDRGARVWGVDPSGEMLAQARLAAPGATFKQARAEALPFKASWFERAVLRTAVHLVDRTRALPELARILAPGGRLAIATFAPERFGNDWLSALFPAVPEIDRRRFPASETLVSELETAGFDGVRTVGLRQHGRLSREEALERIRGRYISTLQLLDEDAFADGLARAESELGETVERTIDWVVLVAERPALSR